MVRQLPLVSRHIYRLVASSGFKFIFFITLSTSFSLFTFDRPRRRLHHGDQVIIRIGHSLSSMHTTCPYHIYILPGIQNTHVGSEKSNQNFTQQTEEKISLRALKLRGQDIVTKNIWGVGCKDVVGIRLFQVRIHRNAVVNTVRSNGVL